MPYSICRNISIKVRRKMNTILDDTLNLLTLDMVIVQT